ncbi:MAG: hypothetical protein KF734_03960 [Saprospiraceae bacterium]|nr:hypothetical protein [Saprospiraceae bacterium]
MRQINEYFALRLCDFMANLKISSSGHATPAFRCPFFPTLSFWEKPKMPFLFRGGGAIFAPQEYFNPNLMNTSALAEQALLAQVPVPLEVSEHPKSGFIKTM